MNRIETEYWKPHPEKPGYVVYDKGRPAQEVFAELRSRLEAAGYLPDEYFLLDRDWEDGRLWPRDGDIFCAVDYGGSEGIYLDIYLKYMDENNKSHTTRFATGKTLGESETDLDRMYLIASAVTKAFHSDGVHARYVQVGGHDNDHNAEPGAIIHLNRQEVKTAARSLLETRESLKAQGKPTEVQEQLLHRITGSVSAHTKALNDFKITDAKDRALLAIRDGGAEDLADALPELPKSDYGELLAHAAARPGRTGAEMMRLLLNEDAAMQGAEYLQACKNAVDLCDGARVFLLLNKLTERVQEPGDTFHSELVTYALTYDEKRGNIYNLARDIISCRTAEQLRFVHPHFTESAIFGGRRRLAEALIDKRVGLDTEPGRLFLAAARQKDVSLAERLIKNGADIDGQYFAALRRCVEDGDLQSAMFLLKCGADFEGFCDYITPSAGTVLPENVRAFMRDLESFWENGMEDAEQAGYADGEDEYENDEDDCDMEQD
ncbi:MAG: ankyrin repeat domain-containing protein [Oscillospiraceae bacterium]|jgi:hypothetical protein|nr:ankyrin repeat domain-containing protein [Oscillospiraceae bacterium]